MRGLLNGLTRVTSLPVLWKRHGLDAKLADRYAKNLLAAGAVYLVGRSTP